MFRDYPTTAEMKHYTTEEFCAEMDAILETITREDTAYIIDVEKGSYVICPAHWFDVYHRRESNFLATYTVKYALLQNKETAELVCADIRRRMYTFSYGTEKIIEDVTAFLKEHPENEAASAWSALITDLKKEIGRMDTVTIEIAIDGQLLRETMEYIKARGITFQQLAETSIKMLIRERPTLSDLQAIDPGSAPAASEPEKKEET